MISLRDRIEIRTSPDHVFRWLESMPQEYKTWHPDHVACRVIHGTMLEEGSVMECEEYLHGKLHSMRFQMTRLIPGERVEFDIKSMGRGAFEIQARDPFVNFVAELDIGSDLPILGPTFDFLFSIFFPNRIKAMQHHMKEEGERLKAILESGTPE